MDRTRSAGGDRARHEEATRAQGARTARPEGDRSDGGGSGRARPGRPQRSKAPVEIVPGEAAILDGLDLRELARQLGEIAVAGLEPLEPRDSAELLGALGQLTSALAALTGRVMTDFGEAVRAEDEQCGVRPRDRGRTVAHDIACAMGQDLSRTRQRVAASRRLVTQMPQVFAALATGRISPEAAHAASRSAAVLDAEQCRQVDELCGENMAHLEAASSGQWAREVAHVAHRLAPEEHAIRHERAKATAGVWFTPGQHGIDHLHADLPAIDAAAIRRKLTLAAERARREGDDRPSSVIMVTALADTLLGRDEGLEPVRLDVGVMITDRALRDPDCGDPAIIEGYGPVHPGAVREALGERDLRTRAARSGSPRTVDAAAGADAATGGEGEDIDPRLAVMRRVYTHPTTGELVAMESRARAFPAAMMRMLLWRDERCVAPHCGAPIRHADHVTPHAAGGATSMANGQGLCAACNYVKESMASISTSAAGAGRDATGVRGGCDRNDGGGRRARPALGARSGRVSTWTTRFGRVRRMAPPTLSGRALPRWAPRPGSTGEPPGSVRAAPRTKDARPAPRAQAHPASPPPTRPRPAVRRGHSRRSGRGRSRRRRSPGPGARTDPASDAGDAAP